MTRIELKRCEDSATMALEDELSQTIRIDDAMFDENEFYSEMKQFALQQQTLFEDENEKQEMLIAAKPLAIAML